MEASQPNLNEHTTEHHAPRPRWSLESVLDKLRLFVLVLIKLLLNVSMLVSCLLCLSIVMEVKNNLFFIIVICIAMFIDVVDIVLGLAVTISVFMEYPRIMKIYYKCNIYIFVVLSIFCCVILFFMLGNIGPVVNLLFFLFLALLLQLYLNYSVKNEVMQLKSNEQFRL